MPDIPTERSASQDEIVELREQLVAKERRVQDHLNQLIEPGRKQLEALQTIASLQQEISRLTRLTCELRAENQGFRDQLGKEILPIEPSFEAVDEAEKYPVGEGKDPINWLCTHYGHRLIYFGAPRNSLFQDQLRKIDPGLMQALQNRLKYERRRNGGIGLRLREIIPTKADRNSQRLATALANIEANPDIPYVAAYRAQKRSAR